MTTFGINGGSVPCCTCETDAADFLTCGWFANSALLDGACPEDGTLSRMPLPSVAPEPSAIPLPRVAPEPAVAASPSAAL